MKKLLAAVLASLFATAAVSPVAFAAEEKKDKKEQSKDKKKAEDKK
jgi:hypothetical protein